MKITILNVLIAGSLVLIGAGCITIAWIIHAQATNLAIAPPNTGTHTSSAAAQPAATQASVISGEPVQIEIPSLQITLPIVPGTYNARTQQWTLTLNKVQYASMTPQPNTLSGNTFLYGHYRANVFATLHTIHAHAQAVLTTSNGHTFYYQLYAITVVSPTDSKAVFDYSGPPILTVQTCTGLFFQNRQLFTFNLVKAA